MSAKLGSTVNLTSQLKPILQIYKIEVCVAAVYAAEMSSKYVNFNRYRLLKPKIINHCYTLEHLSSVTKYSGKESYCLVYKIV